MIASVIFLGEVGPMQIILVLAIILLLFGGKKIPELMKGLGTGIKEFKNAQQQQGKGNKTKKRKNKRKSK